MLCFHALYGTITVIYDGLIWFIIPIFLVIINDTFAYLVGRSIGKTPLIKLSPNKTVEGFIGGVVFTIIIGSIFIQLVKLDFLIPLFCPQNKFTMIPFSYPVCERPLLFIQRNINYPLIGSFYVSEFSNHLLALVLFCSFIAPFGGFFASGIKRSLQLKDFANLIPGHGGVTDRLDCIMVMMIFTYVYLTEIIKGNLHSLTSVIFYLNRINEEDQYFIYMKLKTMLKDKIEKEALGYN